MNEHKQQIGGYTSPTNASKDRSLDGIVAARISPATDVVDGSYTSESNLVRIAAIEDSHISLENTDTGMLMPSGTVEYFSVSTGSVIYITGSVNISSIE